jgi:hypothetical protein
LLLAPAGDDKRRPYKERSDQRSEHAAVENLLLERPSETASDEHDHGMRATRPPLTPTAPTTNNSINEMINTHSGVMCGSSDAGPEAGWNASPLLTITLARCDTVRRSGTPHAGGVGLCELVQHLSAFDDIAVSANLTDVVVEYVDHLHEHFLDPVRISGERYLLPERAGYSAQMHAETLARFAYPHGVEWAEPAHRPRAVST